MSEGEGWGPLRKREEERGQAYCLPPHGPLFGSLRGRLKKKSIKHLKSNQTRETGTSACTLYLHTTNTYPTPSKWSIIKITKATHNDILIANALVLYVTQTNKVSYRDCDDSNSYHHCCAIVKKLSEPVAYCISWCLCIKTNFTNFTVPQSMTGRTVHCQCRDVLYSFWGL